VRFLGYDGQTCTGDRVVKTNRNGTPTTFRSTSERIDLLVPRDKGQGGCRHHGYGDLDSCKGPDRRHLLHRSDAEIILTYNAELRGCANSYALSPRVKQALKKLMYRGPVSLFKTLANKHQTSVHKIQQSLRIGKNFVYRYEAQGKPRQIKVFARKDLKKSLGWGSVDKIPDPVMYTQSRTELLQRLKAEVCEYCGQDKGYFEVHHVRKLSDIKDGKAPWERMMMAMQRKTMILCVECHDLLTWGKLPSWKRNVKVESRVR
jgi:hypothetical protein